LDYADYTRNTTEPLKRIAHFRRYKQVVDLIAQPSERDAVLDYGCGDAHLFSHFVPRFSRNKLVGYDPNPKLLAQASAEVATGSVLTTDIEAIKLGNPFGFSLIYCMEVCEHLTDRALDELFQNLRALAATHARIVFGIPLEVGLSGFLKSLYRLAHHDRLERPSVANAFRSLFGISIERKITDVEWFGNHTGFDYRRLRCQLEQNGFRVKRSRYLPFPMLGPVLNNEIYFVCRLDRRGF
jgi:SAM-dependent methyltransferase